MKKKDENIHHTYQEMWRYRASPLWQSSQSSVWRFIDAGGEPCKPGIYARIAFVAW
ncbi:MAG: hypothetical protein ACFN9G_09600 [Cardiobacterium sp.]